MTRFEPSAPLTRFEPLSPYDAISWNLDDDTYSLTLYYPSGGWVGFNLDEAEYVHEHLERYLPALRYVTNAPRVEDVA
jgi:hypothetical protein